MALMSMFAGDPMKQTLFKTAGAAIGGGLGLALGPIGMIVGEIAGEFVGDVLYTGFSGDAGGWKAAGKKLKDKFFQIVDGGKAFTKWIGSGFSRFIENFKAENTRGISWPMSEYSKSGSLYLCYRRSNKFSFSQVYLATA